MTTSIIWNYHALLEKGTRLIEELSSSNWTDYNVHDPGITTLEFLCYGLTDLAARVGLPMESHLAEKVGERIRLRNDFAEAHEILPCAAVTVMDYRKLLIDLPGIRNAWLHIVSGIHPPIYANAEKDKLSFAGEEKDRLYIRGLSNVEIEFDKMVTGVEKEVLFKKIRGTLMANRNLCEDFNEIKEIELEEVSACIDVELTLDSNVDEVKAEILYALDEFIAPTLRRYSLEEMLAKGYRIEEILNGPLPRHGFIEDKDLSISQNRGELHGSDLVQLLMDIPQVVAVRRLLFTTYQDGEVVELDESAIVKLSEKHVARFSREKSKFRFFKEKIPYISSPAGVEHALARVRTRYQQAPILEEDLRPELPSPEYIATGNYSSIQRHYPRNYGVGHEGIAPQASAGRKAAVKQFKAYLLLFEQFLADFNGQIEHAVNLISPFSVQRTYAHVLPEDVPRFAELVRDAEKIASYYEDTETFQGRRNRFLDHLLARFAEQYREYSMLVENACDKEALPLLIGDKERLLNNFATLSFSRFQAYDYTLLDEAKTISGLERRLRILLGYTSDIDISVLQEQHFEIYEELDDDGIEEFRFRLIDDNDNILLSSTKRMLTLEETRYEMRTSLFMGTNPDNYEISETKVDTWHFTLHDKDGDMIARRIQYFATFEECRVARDECVTFMRTLFPDNEIFVLEHMLLRPCFLDEAIDQEAYVPENDDKYLLSPCFDDEDCECSAADAYSFRISVIMPSWPERFQDMNFRNFLARFIREQTPAHIFAKICWISLEQMNEFRVVYEDWQDALAIRGNILEPTVYLDRQERLISVWRQLRSVYPQVHLYDCADVKNITPTVLGDSALGVMNGASDDQD
jgi:hypothetical protein